MVTIEFFEAFVASASEERGGVLRFYLDNPKAGKRYRASSVEVGGWILSATVPVVAIEVRVNGHLVDQLPVDQPRPDVAAEHVDHPDSLHSGFAARVNLVGEGIHAKVELAAVLANNESIALATLTARRRAET